MSTSVAYAILSRLPEPFIENSIQDVLESEMERLEREERKLLAILEIDLIDIMQQTSIPKFDKEGKE